MKEKMKRRVQMRHEVSDHSKIDRVVQKSFTKEASHKLESTTFGGGFFSAVKRILNKVFGFFRSRKVANHYGVSTKSYCQKFGGASGGTIKRELGLHPGKVGNKLKKKLLVNKRR